MRSLRRGIKPNFDRGFIPVVSLVLAGATISVILLGLMWAWRLGPTALWLRQTVISWHWILALIIMPPFVLHAWRRWPRPKKAEFISREISSNSWALARSVISAGGYQDSLQSFDRMMKRR